MKRKMLATELAHRSKSMEKRYLKCLAIFLVLLFATAFLPPSSMAREVDQSNLETRATHILIGKVKAVESRWNDEKTFIYSNVAVTVEKVLKGTVKTNQVVIRHLGGEIGAIGQWTEHEPSFTKGEEVKLYLKQEQNGVYTVVGGAEGKKSPKAKEVTSRGYNWQGHHWPQASLPVKYWINLAGTPAGTSSNIQMAFQTWEEDPGSYMDYTNAGTTTKTGGYDGYNVAYWGYIDGAYNVIAVCTFWYNTSTLEIVEFDVKFDSGDSWQIYENTASSTSFDVRNIATHEFGHSLGLLDLYDPADASETMYGYVSTGQTTRRTLYTGDVQGLNTIYPVTYNLGTTVRTDKTGYKPTWPVQVSLRITAKWIYGKTIDFWWILYFGGGLYPILYAPGVKLPEMFEMVIDVDFTMPNLGATTTTQAGWITIMTDAATKEWLGWDYCLWLYVPSSSTTSVVAPGDFAAQLANNISLPL